MERSEWLAGLKKGSPAWVVMCSSFGYGSYVTGEVTVTRVSGNKLVTSDGKEWNRDDGFRRRNRDDRGIQTTRYKLVDSDEAAQICAAHEHQSTVDRAVNDLIEQIHKASTGGGHYRVDADVKRQWIQFIEGMPEVS